MSEYMKIKCAESETQRYFKMKYGFLWRFFVRPSITCDEYYNKFKSILSELEPKPLVELNNTKE